MSHAPVPSENETERMNEIHATTSDSWRSHGFTGSASDLLVDQTIVGAWESWVELAPDQPVFCEFGGEWLSASELHDQVKEVVFYLEERGLILGDRVLMSCQPSVALIVVHLAVLSAGLVVVPVNTAFTGAELSNIAAEASPQLVVLDDPSRFPNCPVNVLTPQRVISESKNIVHQGNSSERPRQRLLGRRADSLRADDPALLVFTSGTTGKPKGALLTHGNLLSSAKALVIAWQWTPKDRLVLSLPLFHMHGLGVGVHGTLVAGASAVIVPKFSPDAVLDAARAESGTMLFGVPTMWVRLLDSPRVAEMSNLRLCVSGSAALSPEVWEGLRDRAGQEIVERYGMTETVMNISNPLIGERRPGSVGLVLPGVEVRLDHPGADGVGEILLRGPNVFGGYWNRPDANEEAFTRDGWFRSGDLGRIDADGYVTIVGRSKDLIISGGYNVYPRDVEDILRSHPDVADASVVGEPSLEWGETVTACIVVRDGHGVSGEELLSFCTEHLAGYQRPRRVVFVEEFPRNALGKVVKAELTRTISTPLR
jgi:malonyl-CoA/methylmalonyl-CoA synthetase